jgi:hypothetical protein
MGTCFSMTKTTLIICGFDEEKRWRKSEQNVNTNWQVSHWQRGQRGYPDRERVLWITDRKPCSLKVKHTTSGVALSVTLLHQPG